MNIFFNPNQFSEETWTYNEQRRETENRNKWNSFSKDFHIQPKPKGTSCYQ